MGATRRLLVRSITPDRREPSVELDAERMRSLLSLHRTVFIDLMLDCVVEPAERSEMPVSGMTRGRVQPIALPQNETSYKFSLHICPIPRITSWLTRHTAVRRGRPQSARGTARRARLRAPASGVTRGEARR